MMENVIAGAGKSTYEGLSPLDYAAGRLRRANLTLPPDEYEEDL
ncbi:MAG: hypothetical protein SPL30_00680 [Succinivibrio sp.]|nr:hypothetical protein [Succinivibrio sp.]